MLAAAVAEAETLGAAGVSSSPTPPEASRRWPGSTAPSIAIRHAVRQGQFGIWAQAFHRRVPAKRLTQDDVLWRAISGRGDAFVVQGGFPADLDGRVVGAIGVATGAHEHDSEIAQAGVAALEALAAAAPPS